MLQIRMPKRIPSKHLFVILIAVSGFKQLKFNPLLKKKHFEY